MARGDFPPGTRRSLSARRDPREHRAPKASRALENVPRGGAFACLERLVAGVAARCPEILPGRRKVHTCTICSLRVTSAHAPVRTNNENDSERNNIISNLLPYCEVTIPRMALPGSSRKLSSASRRNDHRSIHQMEFQTICDVQKMNSVPSFDEKCPSLRFPQALNSPR